jgi:hypothetical protein
MKGEHYNAEDLVEPFYFNRPTQTPDGSGGYATTLTRNPVSGYHFAKVRALRGGERVVEGHLANTSEVQFVVYAALGILPTDRIVYDGREYSITRTNPPGRSVFQEIEATAGVTL